MTSAPSRRSRGSSRRCCPSGTRPRRSSSPARGTNALLAEDHSLHIIARTGVSAPRCDCGEGSFAIVYAEHEVVFLQSDQADRAIGTWIDIPLHMNPLMRANEDYKDDRAGSAWDSERGRASPCAGLGISSSHWSVFRGMGVRICPASIMLGYTLIPSPCSCGIPRACRSIRGSRGSAWR